MTAVVSSTSDEVSHALRRILPSSLEEPDVGKTVDAFQEYAVRLTKREYEAMLSRLPKRLDFDNLSSIWSYRTDGWTNAEQNLYDIIAHYAVLGYITHVPAWTVLAHLLRRLKMQPGSGIRLLVGRMSWQEREGLFARLIEIDDSSGEDRYGIVDEFEQTLHEKFAYVRPGFFDWALTEIISQLEEQLDAGEMSTDRPRATRFLEAHILRSIRKKRRNDPDRLPEIKSAASARFVVEEIDRELRLYLSTDVEKTVGLARETWSWYEDSKARERVIRNAIYLDFSTLFGQVQSLPIRLENDFRPVENWKAYALPFLQDDEFWHNLAGLNDDPGVPYESTEAARREAAFRRGAVIGPLAIVAPLVVVLVIAVAVRTPGAAVALVRWVGSRLVLASQYAAATYRVYGAIAGTSVAARDAYVFYATNAVTVNSAALAAGEIAFAFAGQDTGHAPGSSPADLADAAADVTRVAKRGISGATRAIDGEGTAVRYVELTVTTDDGRTLRVIGEVKGIQNGNVITTVRHQSQVLGDYQDASHKVVFYTAADDAGEGAVSAAHASGLDLTPSTGTVSHGTLLGKPKKTVVGGRRVTSWHPDVLVGTSQDQMRNASLRIITDNPGHSLEGVLVDGRFLSGGTKENWAKDARYLEAAHVMSKKTGGADICVLMSAKYNRKYSGDLEQAGTPGAMLFDEVLDIGGIAFHKQTARDLVDQGYLDASAVDNAKTIDLRDLEFPPPVSAPATAAKSTAGARGTGNTGKQAKGTSPAQRGTGKAAPAANAASGTNNLLPSPDMTEIRGYRMKSWHPTTLVGTSQSQMRENSERLMNSKDSPLKRVLVDGRLLSGGNKATWKKDARYLAAAHVVSKKAGGPDIIVLMSMSENSRFSSDLELKGTPGAVALDEVLSIGNIAMQKTTALELVEQGWLEKSVVDNAETIDLRDLEL